MSSHSNPEVALLVEALHRFARPERNEKTLEELERLLHAARTGTRSGAETAVVRVHNIERRLGGEVIEQIIAAYDAGSSAARVAKDFSVATSTVLRLVRGHGGAVRNRSLSNEAVAEAGALYNLGHTLQQLADQYSISKSAMRRALIESGVTMRLPRHHS